MSSSSVLGTLVVRIVAEMRKYREDLNAAARDTEAAAGKMGKASGLANEAAARMGGGLGEAAQAARGLHAAAGVAGLSVAALAAGAAAAGYAAYQGAKEQKAYEKALILTGNAAGVTAGQMADMAAGIDRVVGTQAEAAAALALMAASGKVAGENLQKFSQVAIEMERAAGQSVADTVKQFAQLGDDPVKASIKLNESLNYLTASTFEQIKAAQDLGDKERAASIAQNAYAEAMRSRAVQLEQNAGTIERSWRKVRDVAKEAWDAMLGIGRQTTAGEQLSAIQSKLDLLRNEQARGLGTFGSTGSGKIAAAEMDKQIRQLEAQAAALGGVAHAASEAAKAQADKAAKEKAGIQWMQEGEKYLDRAAKLNQKIVEITVEGVKAGASQIEIDRRIAIEREKAAEKGARATKAAVTDAERMAQAGEKLAASLLAQEQGLSGDFAQKWDQLGAAYKAGAISLDVLVQAQARLLAQQPGIKATTEAMDKATLAAAQANEKYVESLTKGLGKLEEEIAQQKLHNAQIGLGKDAIAELNAAELERQAATLEGMAIRQMDKNLDEVQYNLLMAQARALRELAALKREGGAKEAAVEAAKDAHEAWKKASAQIEQSLSDALMNAFTAGKGFGKTFVASIKGMFNSMVLRPVISAIVSPVAGAVTGALGFSGAANAAGTAGNLLSGGSSLFGAGSTLAGIGSFMGELGTGLLASTQTALGLTATAAQASYAASLGVAAQTGSLVSSLAPLISAAPYLAAIAGIYALAKNLDHSGTPHTGGGSAYSAAGGLTSTSVGGWTGGTAWGDGFGSVVGAQDANDMTAKLVQSIVGILDTTATTFGKAAGYTAATAFADDSSKDGAWGSLLIKQMDSVLVNWADTRVSKWAPKVFSDGSAGSAEYLAAVSADVRSALDAIGLPDWATKMLSDLGDAPTLEQLAGVVTTINQTQAVLQKLGGAVQGFGDLTGTAVLNIINASGGLQALSANLEAYYNAFYSEQERYQNKLASFTSALTAMADGGAFAGNQQAYVDLLTSPTRAAYRALVEAQDLTTESGQRTYAALLGMAGTFDELRTAADAASGSVAEAAKTVNVTMADLVQQFDKVAETLLSAADLTAYRITRIKDTLAGVGLDVTADQIRNATRSQIVAILTEAVNAGNYAAAQGIMSVVDALTLVAPDFQDLSVELAAVDTTAAAAVNAIHDVARTLGDVSRQFDGVASTLLSGAELTAYKIASIQATLAAGGINVTAEQIRNATREQILAGLGEVIAAGNYRAASAIMQVVGALSEVSLGFQQVSATASNAAAVLQQRQGLESQILNLTGNTAEIRARELAGLDASNRGLQEHIYAIQDAQAAVQAADAAYQSASSSLSGLEAATQRWAATVGTAQGLLDQISGALGGAGGNNEAALWAQVNGTGSIDDRLRAAQELFSLINQTASVQDKSQQTAIANAKALLDYGLRLRDYVQSLLTSDISTLTPEQKVAQALADYQSTLARAQAGDQTALGNLQGVSDTYLRLAREFDPASYNGVFASVTSAVSGLADNLVSDNQRLADLAQQQVDATGTTNALSADQLARLTTLQSVVQGLYAEAGAQQATANAQYSSAQANLASLQSAQSAANAALTAAMGSASSYLASLPAAIVAVDPVPNILLTLPAGIAAALAPLINTNAAAGATYDIARANEIRAYAASLPQDATGARQLYDAAVQYGVSSGELDAAMGWAAGTSLMWAINNGLPAFAQGTNYVPHDMVAQIHQGEAIVPRAYNPAAGGNAELLAELRALREEVARLREQNNKGHEVSAWATERNTQQIGHSIKQAASVTIQAERVRQQAAIA